MISGWNLIARFLVTAFDLLTDLIYRMVILILQVHREEEISQNKAVTSISHLSFHAKILELTAKTN